MPRPCLTVFAALFFTFTLSLSSAAAAGLEFAWAVSAGGKGNDKTRAITTDAQGNVYLAGEFNGPAKFGEHELPGAGGYDYFLAKCDRDGKFLWAHSGGGSAIDRAYGVATDPQGNCYVTGHYQSTNATFSGQAIGNAGDYDVFVAKYSPAGDLLWLKSGGGKGYDYGHGIAVDAHGNAYVTGAIVGDARFGDTTLTNPPGAHVFCASYDTQGTLRWVKTTTGKAASSGHGIAVDAAGNAYVGGYTGGLGSLGGHSLTNAKGRDLLVAKFTPAGEVAWVAQGHGSTNAMAHEIAVDAQGNVWAAGMFKGTAKLAADQSTTSQGDSDWLLVHYDSTGQQRWARSGGGPKVDYGLGIVAGNKGSAFLTGEFSETASFDGRTLTSLGATDVYLAAFGPDGKITELLQAGGTRGDNAYVITRDAAGNLYLSGSFGGTASYGEHSITSSGGNDLYVAKVRAK